jgi:uncharacterized protein YdcH (DUF465 family)
MDKNKLESHLKALTDNHKALDKNIKRGYTNYTDDVTLAKMKQEKAHVKREIIKIEKQLAEYNEA